MDPDFSNKGVRTKAIHAGEHHDTASHSSAPYLESDAPYVYTRWANPTTNQLEEKLAVLEHGEACIAVSLGHHRSLMFLLQTDDLAGTTLGLEDPADNCADPDKVL